MTEREQPTIPGTQPLDVDRREVRCTRCRRELTDATSRLYALGPDCRHQVAVTPRGFDIDQEQLPGM